MSIKILFCNEFLFDIILYLLISNEFVVISMLREYIHYALNLCLGHSYYLNHKMMLNFNIYFESDDTITGSTPTKKFPSTFEKSRTNAI